jgi:hypothetical protein
MEESYQIKNLVLNNMLNYELQKLASENKIINFRSAISIYFAFKIIETVIL